MLLIISVCAGAGVVLGITATRNLGRDLGSGYLSRPRCRCAAYVRQVIAAAASGETPPGIS